MNIPAIDMKKNISKSVLTAIIFLLLLTAKPVGVYAQLSPEDVVNIKHVGDVVMQPQGNYVAYTLRVPRQSEDEIGGDYSEVRVLDLATGDISHIVTRPGSASLLSWVPGTNRIAFRTVRSEHHDRPQVYSMDVAGGDLQQHTSAPEGVMAYAFASDPSLLAYTMRSPYPDEVQRRREQGFDMEVYGENERHVRLWVQDNGEARSITREDMSVWDFEWSPDNHRLAVRMTYGTGLDDEMMFSEILVVSAGDGDTDLLAESQGKVGKMTWSPDGNRFGFLAAKAINDPLPQRIYITEVGDYVSTDITPVGYEGTVEWLEWKDNSTLRFVAVEGTRTALREIPASGGEARRLMGGELEIFRSASFQENQNTFAAAVNRRDHPAEVYVGTLSDSRFSRLTHHNSFLEERKMGRQTTIEWLGPDGLLIEGVLTYPVGYEQGNVYPLAILPHGGPEGISIDGWNTRPLYPAQVLAAEGYVVLKPNYRGSGGRGSRFTMANHRDLGGKEFEDVIRGIDHLAYQGLVDPRKVGISGTSYGGYFSALAGTRYSERFAAAITFAGLSNWISFMGTTDIPHEMSITHWDLWWFENEGLTWDRSPVAHIQNARTPILVAHGLADDRVHPEQSLQLYQFLNLNDVPTGLVMYPRQPHGLTERAHRIDFMERVIDWFNENLK